MSLSTPPSKYSAKKPAVSMQDSTAGIAQDRKRKTGAVVMVGNLDGGAELFPTFMGLTPFFVSASACFEPVLRANFNFPASWTD